LETSQSDVRVS